MKRNAKRKLAGYILYFLVSRRYIMVGAFMMESGMMEKGILYL